jgi:hypothetical protein
MTKEIPAHKDRLGRLLKIGDCVAYPDGNSLEIGLVKKINPKMIGVSRIKAKWQKNKYPSDIVLLEGPEVTMFLLREAAK